ncbi:MAG: 4Fe-4S dicluster domain-containing protein [Candidatus Riflebacteria bacterium]|nr:4Fe-4S dicluster domain-containing protein [Candidatus Riflebacteria bacterium]
MNTTRRCFLKNAAGLTLLGVTGGSRLLAAALERSSYEASPKQLQGKRWAMLVDMRKCTAEGDCKLCLEACHGVHNVPEMGSPKEEIKWIWKEPCEHVFPEMVSPSMTEALRKRPTIVLCNHCDNPSCVRVCPTQATWKRPDGIVMMDMHRCIGCRYCIVACPYGSRSFNFRDPRPHIKKINESYPTRMRGVVEKCNFCEERLADGLLPACVEACKAKALQFGDLADRSSQVFSLVSATYQLRRRTNLGTEPQVYYLL